MTPSMTKYAALLSSQRSSIDSHSSCGTADQLSNEVDLLPAKPFFHPKNTLIVLSVINVLLATASFALYADWYYETRWRPNAALRKANTYSPIYDMIDLEIRPLILNGSLFPSQDPSVGRQSPNPAADRVWEDWELMHYIPVTSSQIKALGKDPSTAAKLENEDWGLGPDAYAAVLDVYHQLHCLNTLRKIAYSDYYNMTKEGPLHALHLNHCVDMLMQNLQCNGNLNMIVMNWMTDQPYPFPDMSIQRQCVNFDQLTEWRTQNSLNLTKYLATMKKKPGTKEMPAPKEYYKYFGSSTGVSP